MILVVVQDVALGAGAVALVDRLADTRDLEADPQKQQGVLAPGLLVQDPFLQRQVMTEKGNRIKKMVIEWATDPLGMIAGKNAVMDQFLPKPVRNHPLFLMLLVLLYFTVLNNLQVRILLRFNLKIVIAAYPVSIRAIDKQEYEHLRTESYS